MGTGRVILLENTSDSIDDKLRFFLSNDKFHEFYNYQIEIREIEELEALIEKFNQKYRHINIELPKEFGHAYQQFLSFFTEYVDTVKGRTIKFDVNKSFTGLSIDLEVPNDDISVEEVNTYLDEYIQFAGNKVDALKINVQSDITIEEFDIFSIKLENQVSRLSQDLKISNMNYTLAIKREDELKNENSRLEDKNSHLTDENSFLRILAQKFADKENTIRVQLLNGGGQQFADIIKNEP